MMNEVELEWKTKEVHRVWRAAAKRMGGDNGIPFGHLPESIKYNFRVIAKSRKLKVIEVAWRSHTRKNRSVKSPYRETALSAARARGQGRTSV